MPLCPGYEVVDVDGLVFRRKRKSSGEQSPEGRKRSKSAAGSPPQALNKGCVHPGGAEELYTCSQPAEPEIAERVACRVEADALKVPSAENPVPLECTESLLSRLPAAASEADRLLCLCDELAKVGICNLINRKHYSYAGGCRARLEVIYALCVISQVFPSYLSNSARHHLRHVPYRKSSFDSSELLLAFLQKKLHVSSCKCLRVEACREDTGLDGSRYSSTSKTAVGHTSFNSQAASLAQLQEKPVSAPRLRQSDAKDTCIRLACPVLQEDSVLADGSQVGPNQGTAAMLELLKEGVSAALQDRTLICHSSGDPAGLSAAALAKERAAQRLAKEKQLQGRLDAYRQVWLSLKCCALHNNPQSCKMILECIISGMAQSKNARLCLSRPPAPTSGMTSFIDIRTVQDM